MHEELKELLARGMVNESMSSFVVQAILVSKKDGICMLIC